MLTKAEEWVLDNLAINGVPVDSMERFYNAGYAPQPKQAVFHGEARKADFNDVEQILYGGARGGGKTHCVFAQAAIDDCQKFEGLQCLFIRKKAGSAEESLDALTRKVLFKVPHSKKLSQIIYPNGSKIKIGHFQYEKDIDNYLSLEYDLIVIEQAEQLTPTKLIDITTVNRTSRDDFKPRIYLTNNWGGVSHTHLKETFYVPFRDGAQTTTRFVPATVKDNVQVDKGYTNKLEQLTGWKRRAWLDGDPDVFAGQFFDRFRYDHHTFDDTYFFTPDYISTNWENVQPWGSFDWGFRHWAVFYLGYKHDGVIHVLDECAVRNQLDVQIAEAINETCARWNLKPSQLRNIAAGTDCFEVKSNTGESIADEFTKKGVYLNSANTARQAGASKILTLLGDIEQGIPAKVKINRRCKMLIEQLPAMVHDPDKPGDVDKVNADENGFGGDDAYDSFRYLVMDDNDSTGIF